MKMEELDSKSNSSHYNMYTGKGKRTKRMRLLSSSGGAISTYERQETEDMANCLILLAKGDHRCDVETQKGNNKVGFYIYECKTCNRRFPSFQALGGHRASHNKPKLGAQDKKTAAAASLEGGDVKSHDCSICGSEFSSGQALGGHMRRHRASSTLAVHPFDLNLPPPQDHPNFQFPPTTHLLLPTPAFVDCHY